MRNTQTLPFIPVADPEAWLRAVVGGLSRISPRSAARASAKIFFSPPRLDRPPWERALAARGEPLELKNGIVGHAFGEGDQKILLVHGWSGRGTQLGRFVEPLVSRGFRVFAIDGPAHGDSAGQQTDASQFADALVTVGSELGPFRAVVAHSFGGVASVIATPRGLPTERLVLIASPSNVEGVIDRFCDRLDLTSAARRHFSSLVEERVGLSYAAVSPRDILPRVDRPVLVVHSKDDDDVPYSDAVENAEASPRAELLALEDLGHRRLLKDEAVIARVVDFVS